MLREPPIDVDGGYQVCPHIMESALELSQSSKYLPDTAELPTTHEHFVETRVEERNGQALTIRYVGVRRKAVPEVAVHVSTAQPAHPEADGLNQMTDADLETEAAKSGVVNYPKNAAKAKRVAAIREARAAVGKPVFLPEARAKI